MTSPTLFFAIFYLRLNAFLNSNRFGLVGLGPNFWSCLCVSYCIMGNPMTDDTLQLIHRAQADDQKAFAALFERYKNLVYRTAYLALGDTHSAEDALQEVFVLVHRSLRGFDPHRAAFSTWLYRITINYCLNHRRRRSLLSAPLDELATTGEFPGAQAGDEDVWQAVHSLTAKQRAVVILRYSWELSYADMAQVLEIPLGTVKSRLDLALKTLRRVLDGKESCPGCMPEVEAIDEL
jgi:RNA polymerase sigma factor (sigma-70 family)